MKMGCSQKQAISVQHRKWNKTSEPTRGKYRKPLEFSKWFLVVMRKQEAKGAEFTFLCPGLVRIQWPDKPVVFRTVEDIRREYETEYLSKF